MSVLSKSIGPIKKCTRLWVDLDKVKNLLLSYLCSTEFIYQVDTKLGFLRKFLLLFQSGLHCIVRGGLQHYLMVFFFLLSDERFISG